MQNQRVLIIGTVWPEPDSSAAGGRMMQLVNMFREENHAITFSSASANSPYAVNLEEYGVNKVPVELNNSSFDDFITQLNPGIVLFDRFMTEEQYGWRVAKHCPGALRVLDMEDLHCLRYAREKAFKENRAYTNNDLFNDIALREIASVYRCDISLVISKVEMELICDVFGVNDALLHYIPFMYDETGEKEIVAWPLYEERAHFISIGNFLHEPNRNAVVYLKETIWPLIRAQLPKAELHIYGAYPAQQVLQMHKPTEGFMVKGRAGDAKKVVSLAKVSLAPLRIGAGLKGKLAEAMACGTPSVTTAIGAEGMYDQLPWNGFIHDEPGAFANAAVELYSNKEVWLQKQANGVMLINKLFSKHGHQQQLIGRFTEVSNMLEEHRKANFTGAMLQHHAAASTMYMSRWIEAKNKS